MTITQQDVDRANVQAFRLLAGIQGIAMEINHGMKPTRGFSGVRFAKEYGYTGPAKLKNALEYLIELSAFEVQPGSNVAKALAK